MPVLGFKYLYNAVSLDMKLIPSYSSVSNDFPSSVLTLTTLEISL